MSQVARELGISNSALYRWVAEDDFAKAEAEKAAGVVPVLDADEQAELVRLRREVRRLATATVRMATKRRLLERRPSVVKARAPMRILLARRQLL